MRSEDSALLDSRSGIEISKEYIDRLANPMPAAAAAKALFRKKSN